MYIKEITDLFHEHNNTRHGETPDDAYIRIIYKLQSHDKTS